MYIYFPILLYVIIPSFQANHCSANLQNDLQEPAEPVTELVLPEPCRNYQPLKLKYRVTSTEPVFYQPQAEYPIAVEVPEVPQPLEIITPDQDFQGKSYTYSIQAPLLPSSTPISRRYDFDFEVPSTSPVS